jgi:hypothetical protein
MNKTQIVFLFVASIVLNIAGYAQVCSSCTINVTSASSSNYTLNAGDVMCISATGSVSGNITLNGGTLCNSGSTSGNILLTNGTVYNYGSITGATSYINHDGGSFYNYGTIQNGGFTSVGHDLVIENYGSIITDYIDIDYISPGNTPYYLNEGLILTTSITIDSGSFYNSDSIILSQNLVIGLASFFSNAGVLNVGGNLNISNVNARFHTLCTVNVTGNLLNTGTITGPFSPCGGFIVSGFASNTTSGNIATDGSYIDICEQGNPNGLSNLGNLGPNFTQCSCTTTCAAFMSISTTNPSNLSIYPNPAQDELIIEGTINGSVMLYDLNGRIVQSFATLQNERTIISLVDISPGVYVLEVNGEHHRIVHQ